MVVKTITEEYSGSLNDDLLPMLKVYFSITEDDYDWKNIFYYDNSTQKFRFSRTREVANIEGKKN